jgi:uncharacterized protein
MKQRVLLAAGLTICLLFQSPARAAPPSDAQIDKMLDTMDMQRTLDEMYVQIDAMSTNMGLQMLGEDATPEQRESLRRVTAQQQSLMRSTLSWDTLGPIYRKVYGKLFSAEEVEAMTAFYGSETGRGIMRKMPQAMQLSMEEMQPLMRSMIEDMKKTLETEIERPAAKKP